jgi:hypothetical protein
MELPMSKAVARKSRGLADADRPVSVRTRSRSSTAAAARRGEAATAPLVAKLMGATGRIAIDDVADTFQMSKGQFAETLGLKRETLYKAGRAAAPKTQTRVREMLEIISRVADWAGGEAQAMAWYRAQPIAAFGGRTAEALVKSGEAAGLRDYLDHIAIGGFA